MNNYYCPMCGKEMMIMDDIVTSDMGKFGLREIEMAKELMTAWVEQGLPEDFDQDGAKVAMNMNSGYVFLTNDEYQVAMMNGDVLESFYSCPECDAEGFAEDVGWDGKHGVCSECSPLKPCQCEGEMVDPDDPDAITCCNCGVGLCERCAYEGPGGVVLCHECLTSMVIPDVRHRD